MSHNASADAVIAVGDRGGGPSTLAMYAAKRNPTRPTYAHVPVVSRNSIGRNVSEARCLPMGKERLYRRDLDA